jgi:hypothetical protein
MLSLKAIGNWMGLGNVFVRLQKHRHPCTLCNLRKHCIICKTSENIKEIKTLMEAVANKSSTWKIKLKKNK